MKKKNINLMTLIIYDCDDKEVAGLNFHKDDYEEVVNFLDSFFISSYKKHDGKQEKETI